MFTMTQPGFLPEDEKFGTIANHAGLIPEEWEMSVVPPIILSTTFKHYAPDKSKNFAYSRAANPTRNILEKCLAELEGPDKYALTFSAGLGAGNALLSMFKSGDHFIVGDALYGGLIRQFRHFKENFGFELTFVDCTDVANIEKAIKPNTKMIFTETPTNPTLKVVDIAKVAAVAKKNNILFAVDNTFLTAYLQKPLDLGADICLYSLTKYMNGHTDVIMGALVMKCKEIYGKLKFLQNVLGLTTSPFDCYQVIRGLKTLHVRMKQHAQNALEIAKFLEGHEKIKKVLYPSLPSHPQYELSKKQTSGSSGVLAFYVEGDAEATSKFLKSLKIFTLAGSLGGTESLVCLPYYMTHPQINHEEKMALGITFNLVRMSVGIEDVGSLIEDIKQGLDKC